MSLHQNFPLSFHVFVYAFHLEISSFFGKFPFSFPIFCVTHALVLSFPSSLLFLKWVVVGRSGTSSLVVATSYCWWGFSPCTLASYTMMLSPSRWIYSVHAGMRTTMPAPFVRTRTCSWTPALITISTHTQLGWTQCGRWRRTRSFSWMPIRWRSLSLSEYSTCCSESACPYGTSREYYYEGKYFWQPLYIYCRWREKYIFSRSGL